MTCLASQVGDGGLPTEEGLEEQSLTPEEGMWGRVLWERQPKPHKMTADLERSLGSRPDPQGQCSARA